MKMRNKRKIIIKDSKLRNLRNSLRKIIFLACQEKLRETEKDRLNWPLRRALNKSICFCEICGQTNKDMIYISDLDEWFCIDCQSLRDRGDSHTKERDNIELHI